MTAEIMQQVLVASRVLYAPNGITSVQEGFSGHVSHRLHEDKYIVAGHTHVVGRSTLDVSYEDLVTVDMKTGKRLEGVHAPAWRERYTHRRLQGETGCQLCNPRTPILVHRAKPHREPDPRITGLLHR